MGCNEKFEGEPKLGAKLSWIRGKAKGDKTLIHVDYPYDRKVIPNAVESKHYTTFTVWSNLTGSPSKPFFFLL